MSLFLCFVSFSLILLNFNWPSGYQLSMQINKNLFIYIFAANFSHIILATFITK
jgi:hypothetical protein